MAPSTKAWQVKSTPHSWFKQAETLRRHTYHSARPNVSRLVVIQVTAGETRSANRTKWTRFELSEPAVKANHSSNHTTLPQYQQQPDKVSALVSPLMTSVRPDDEWSDLFVQRCRLLHATSCAVHGACHISYVVSLHPNQCSPAIVACAALNTEPLYSLLYHCSCIFHCAAGMAMCH